MGVPGAWCVAALISLLLLTGCAALSQNRVKFSSLKASDADIFTLSYPAKLRAATLQLSVDPDMPESGIEQLTLLRQQLTEKQQALNNPTPGQPQNSDDLAAQIEGIKARIRAQVRGWIRVRILAEPPPDVTGTLKITLKAEQASGELDAGSAVEQIKLATESDVKRHLAYRLNEAFFNEPEIIGPLYKELMISIVTLHSEAVAEANAVVEE